MASILFLACVFRFRGYVLSFLEQGSFCEKATLVRLRDRRFCVGF